MGRKAGWWLAALTLALVGGLASGAGAQETRSVKMTAIVEHPALQAVQKGVVDRLAELGFQAGQNLELEFQTAQGDPGTANQIAKKYVGAEPDVIVAISTPSAQTVAAAAHGTLPVVFSAVTDPVAAKLVPRLKQPGGNISGVMDLAPMDKHLDLIREVLPEAKRLGVPYNPGEANAVVLVERLTELGPTKGFEIVTASAPSSNDVLPAVRSLVGKVDAFYTTTDNTVVSAFESIVKVGRDARIPVFAADTDSVARGAVAAVGFDYYDVGLQTGDIVAAVLGGQPIGEIDVRAVETLKLHVNPKSAALMGITIPEATVARAAAVID